MKRQLNHAKNWSNVAAKRHVLIAASAKRVDLGAPSCAIVVVDALICDFQIGFINLFGNLCIGDFFISDCLRCVSFIYPTYSNLTSYAYVFLIR